MNLILTQDSLKKAPWLLNEAIDAISQDCDFLRSRYPLFDEWFVTKVLPGIFTGERTLLIEKRGSLAVAFLILKHTDTEKKLCTLRVRPNFENKGLGIRLFETAFQLLGTEHPLLSVSEPIAPKFERIFKHFGFVQEAVYQGKYIPMVDEFAYNGLLDK